MDLISPAAKMISPISVMQPQKKTMKKIMLYIRSVYKTQEHNIHERHSLTCPPRTRRTRGRSRRGRVRKERRMIYNKPIYQPFTTIPLILKTYLQRLIDRTESTKKIDINLWKSRKKNIHINEHMNKSQSKEALYQESKRLINKYRNLNSFYTDGSVNNDKTGIGIFNQNITLSIRLPDNTTISDAEAYAILKATELAVKSGLNSIIFSDSKSCISAIYTGKSQNPTIIKIINLIINSPINISISWIPSHSGILGNEIADMYAKAATKLNQIEEIPNTKYEDMHKANGQIKFTEANKNIFIKKKHKTHFKKYRKKD
ncbi:unnamed protein product [Meganyctiphanes norvegica]|uniref:ribonuclease H n=1 Tax=Meganyctiphanes norvegica TaxID=48144 RepID=A0AAV2S7P4_MEGNR